MSAQDAIAISKTTTRRNYYQADPTEEESDNFITKAQLRKQQEKLQIKQAIDEMNADMIDDRRLELDEIVEEGLFDGEV